MCLRRRLAGRRPLRCALLLCRSVSASPRDQSACLVLAEHRLGLELEMRGWRMLDWGIGEQLFTRQVGVGISGMIGLHMIFFTTGFIWVEPKWKKQA